MRLRNQLLTLNLKRKSLPPVLYERIDSNNVRIGTKWFKFKMNWLHDYENPCSSTIHNVFGGVTIFINSNSKRFISNSWYDINTNGTYEEFERSFELWIKSL